MSKAFIINFKTQTEKLAFNFPEGQPTFYTVGGNPTLLTRGPDGNDVIANEPEGGGEVPEGVLAEGLNDVSIDTTISISSGEDDTSLMSVKETSAELNITSSQFGGLVFEGSSVKAEKNKVSFNSIEAVSSTLQRNTTGEVGYDKVEFEVGDAVEPTKVSALSMTKDITTLSSNGKGFALQKGTDWSDSGMLIRNDTGGGMKYELFSDYENIDVTDNARYGAHIPSIIMVKSFTYGEGINVFDSTAFTDGDSTITFDASGLAVNHVSTDLDSLFGMDTIGFTLDTYVIADDKIVGLSVQKTPDTKVRLYNGYGLGAEYQSTGDYASVNWATDDLAIPSIGMIKANLVVGTTAKTPTEAGVSGQISYNGGFKYTCVATNTWIREAVEATW